MAPNYQSTSTARVPTSLANGNVTSLAALSVTLPPTVGNGPFLGSGQHPPPNPAPAPPYTEHDSDLEVVGHGSRTPPPSYAESILGLILGDAKTPPYACDSPLHSLRCDPNPNKQDDGDSLYVGASDESSSLQRLRDPCGDNDSAGPDTTSLVQALMPSCYATISTLGSKSLNYHVNPDKNVYRWQITNTPIPVGIDLSSFEKHEHGIGSMVQRCLIIVLDRFNANNVGPKFHFVRDPSYSAFYVTFGGRDPLYANSFFPGSHPRDWYIDVYTSALTLSEDQAQSLMETRLGDFAVAKARALEQNLVKILTHEMLHVVGVRHCDAQVTETADRCVRFPPSLSDEENNEELLMQPTLDWRCLSQVEWKDRTIQEIQQIYAMNVGDRIGRHRIRDVSWEVGAKKRKEIALRNARWCGA